jgi:histidinol-phosphate/aromatic aminotransferase/cobyric acid decarboxylase-like protein
MDIYDYAEEKQISLATFMDFTNCINPLGPSSKAKNSLKKQIKHLDVFPDKKIRYLASLICKKEGIARDNLLFGQGSTHLLHTILQSVKTDKVLTLSPLSQRFNEVISAGKIVIKQLSLEEKRDCSMDLEKVLNAMKGIDTVVMPYPHDMVGTALSTGELLTLIHEIDRSGKTLVLVESYRDYTDLYSPVKEAVKLKGTIILRDFSDFYALAGLPIGYAMGDAEMMINIRRHLFPAEINTLATHAATASLKDGFYKKRTLEFIANEKQFFLKTFSSMHDLSYVDTLCPFFVLKFKDNPGNLRDIFFRYRIIIDEFADNTGHYCLRVPVKKHKWNARFLKTLKNALGVNRI